MRNIMIISLLAFMVVACKSEAVEEVVPVKDLTDEEIKETVF